MRRHELTEREWARLRPHLPAMRPGARDHRTIIDALLWLAKTGAPWRDLPDRLGPWRSVATRSWDRLLAELRRIMDSRGGVDWEVHMVDATNVRAHRHAAGARSGRHAARRHARHHPD